VTVNAGLVGGDDYRVELVVRGRWGTVGTGISQASVSVPMTVAQVVRPEERKRRA
jgi:hypothetical protein